jgi:MADS-box transcription factor
MAEITDQKEQYNQDSPSALDDTHGVGNGNAPATENRGIKRQRPSNADDDDDDDDKPGRERRKIEIKFIADKSRRHITFSKRKAGIMKKVRPMFISSTRNCASIGAFDRPCLLTIMIRLTNCPS